MPTEAAVENLQHEGIAGERVFKVGDVMFDASRHYAGRAAARSQRHAVVEALRGRPFVLATIHRAENTDVPARLDAIVAALRCLAAEVPLVWPLHPRTRQVLAARGMSLEGVPGLHVTEPLGYFDMIELERDCALVVTDSGGVQKEAFFFGRPCVTLRDETEWVELVAAGWNRLAPPHAAEAVLEACRAALGSTGCAVAPYGQGDAAPRIAQVLAGASK